MPCARTSRCASLLFALALPGCVALPFAAPPMRVTVAGGAALGTPARDGDGSTRRVAGVVTTRFAVHPLALVAEERDRTIDFGVGYGFDAILDVPDPIRHEVHATFSGHVPLGVVGETDGRSLEGRLTVDATPAMLVMDREGSALLGFGGTLGVTIELVGFATGAFADADQESLVLGGSLGEAAVGIVARGGFRGVGPYEYAVLEAGLVLRVPAIAGMIFAIVQ